MFPNAPFIKRNGEVDAWDNSDFRAAVAAQNKSQVILAGITTDVCTFSSHVQAPDLVSLTGVKPPRHGVPRSLPPLRRLHRLCQHRGQWHFLEETRR